MRNIFFINIIIRQQKFKKLKNNKKMLTTFFKRLFIVSAFLINLSILLVSSQGPLINDLPGYPYKGKMYSGYLNLSNPLKKLHYLFLESQNDPKNDPVLLWLNGGPGCSSLLGWAQEHGPAVFKELSTEWEINDYSWNKKANVIYLESPAGVGFSYIDSDKDWDWKTNDESSAVQNLEAVIDFFKRFPDFKRNDFYISGESYAGIYVPFLASKIIEYNKEAVELDKIMLKGILVGNGVTDWKYDTTPALIEFAFTHGIYSTELRNKYLRFCLDGPDDTDCKQAESEVMNSLETINIYDIYRTCYDSSMVKDKINKLNKHKKTQLSFLQQMDLNDQVEEIKKSLQKNESKYQYTPWVLKSRSEISIINQNKKSHESLSLAGSISSKSKSSEASTPPCTDSVGPDSFFNRQEVKEALYVKTDLKWGMCSGRVGDNYEINTDKGSFFLYKGLIASGLRILIYSGDTDGAVPFNGTQNWIKNLNLEISKKWRSWRINKSEVAGYVENYKGLTFVTVKGTGHMVPQWKRAEAFYMLDQFLKGEDL